MYEIRVRVSIIRSIEWCQDDILEKSKDGSYAPASPDLPTNRNMDGTCPAGLEKRYILIQQRPSGSIRNAVAV